MTRSHQNNPAGMTKKYAFVKIRTNHTVVRQISNILKHSFPGYREEIIDIKPLLKRRPHLILINIFHILRIYGPDSFTSGKNILYIRFFGTPFMFHQIRKLLQGRISAGGYAFTFQDNSLFDASTPGTPNFVYTDHTLLENRCYPDFDASRDLLCNEWMALEKEIYHNAALVLTRYGKIVDSVVNDYACDRSKVRNIYYAPYDDPDPGTQNDAKYATRNILFVGIEWKRKGGPVLLEAFRQVLSRVPDASLTIVGCMPECDLPNVEIVGKIGKEQLTQHYENASVFCLPTLKEHAGIVFTEAMRYRLPVVGTRIGAIPEYIEPGENGYLVDAGDAGQLAEVLCKLVADQERCRRFGQSSYRKYCDNFTLEVVSGKIRESLTPFISGGDRKKADNAGDATATLPSHSSETA